jgi:hypothetical protein
MLRWEYLWEQRRGCATPFFKQETEEVVWPLRSVSRPIHNRIRTATGECANERSTCTHSHD